MICILAGNYEEARTFARGQLWKKDEWFYPTDITELIRRTNFHVLVIGSAGQNVPANYFEMVLKTARTQGYKNRNPNS